MNTSMTINAPAMYLLALYLAVAEEHGADFGKLSGTTQNDIIKEYLSRGHVRVPAGAVAAADHRHDRVHGGERAEVEPDQRLQLPPAGGRRDAGAGGRVRDVHRDRRARLGARLRPGAARTKFGEVVARISFFVNAGVRFVEEMCKLRAFGELWDEITRERYGVAGRRSSAGSATACRSTRSGLTEAQPENNVYRILLEMLAVTMSKDARARAVQLPAWNEALGPAAAVGPAVVAAHAAGAGVRVRPARVRRPVRRARRSSRRRSTRSSAARAPRSTASSRWAARSRRSSPAT